MQKKTIFKIVAAILFCTSNLTYAKEHPKQWKIAPKQSVYNLTHKQNGKIISTSNITWSDGRSGLVIYIKTKHNIYRCIDWKDKDFRNTGYACYKLVKPSNRRYLPTPTPPKPPPPVEK